MIIDTSVLVAIIRGEPDASAYEAVIARAHVARISAATYVELGLVVDGPRDPVQSSSLDALISSARIRIEPLTDTQARIARSAHERFGRGSGHPASLNMGDCFAYALARELNEPLLFQGRDFALTDIEVVTEPIRSRRLSEIIAAYVAGG